jgi:UDP:flavonoid glycosyltransferase YjiC (YdhE family)
MLDQPLIGRVLEAKGAARLVAKSASADRIRAAVQDLLSDGPHRRAAARLGAEIRRRDGAAEAADRLAALLPSTERDARVAPTDRALPPH